MRAVTLALAAAAVLSGAPVRVLMITGQTDLPHHDWRKSTPFLRQALENTGRFEVRTLEEPRGLNAAALAGYDAVVLNYNGPRWGAAAESALEDFVRSGKGLLAFHGVSYGEFYGQVFEKRWTKGPGPGWTAYAGMLGVSWKPENIGHSARHVFPVKWTDREHPVARGLEPQFLANDELYHRMDHKPNIHVLAAAYSDPAMNGTGKQEPIVWTVPFGRGRVLHTTLGHDLSAMAQPGFLAVFTRGLEWVATGEVAPPAVKPEPVRVLVVTGGHSYPPQFYSLFDGQEDLRWSHATTQAQAFRPDMQKKYDVLLLHDMYESIGEKERAALEGFVEARKGVVSIHHAIVDYTSWPWWHEQVIGGKYFTDKSKFHEGVEVIATPVKGANKHPVMRGVPPLVLRDEVYSGMWHSPGITVLMETAHAENDRPVVYVGPYPKAVYIQFGHEAETFSHPGYRQLVRNAILWTAGRLQ